jgi:four helix bundle protein
MFDFEKLEVYTKAKNFNLEIKKEILSSEKLERVSRDQLRRASMSIVLNIAEGTSRFSDADKRNFYVISRGSVFECVAIFDLLNSEEVLLTEKFKSFYAKAEEISKMLYSMIRNLEKVSIKKV